jgi:DNA polymerase
MPTKTDEYARPAKPPDSSSLSTVRRAAQHCTACHLYKRATQTVFGEGPKKALIMLVGEQPGDYEDVAGKPFVGPAGKIMDRALEEAGIDRKQVYVTNAVKHFKWEPRGKRRIHQRPNRAEVLACHRWLDAELAVFPPHATIVALGATAGQALLGSSFRVGKSRGHDLEFNGRRLVATIHPSAVLRAEGEQRDGLFAALVEDLRQAEAITHELLETHVGSESD